jgi:hypothetical protein
MTVKEAMEWCMNNRAAHQVMGVSLKMEIESVISTAQNETACQKQTVMLNILSCSGVVANRECLY